MIAILNDKKIIVYLSIKYEKYRKSNLSKNYTFKMHKVKNEKLNYKKK